MVSWKVKSFAELSLNELYQIIALREQVFVVEQKIIYQDCDGKDQRCLHLLGQSLGESSLVAYARILPAGLKYPEVAFGRVVVHPEHRKYGIGKGLVKKVIEEIEARFGNVDIRISAQAYLKDFYSRYGFETVGEEYIEEEIPHLEMILEAQKNKNQ